MSEAAVTPRVEVAALGEGVDSALGADLQAFGVRVLRQLQRAVEVSVLLCSDEQMRTLNQQHRQQARPTDVLSFSLVEGDAVPLGTVQDTAAAVVPVGDVVISVDTAARQAAEAGEPLQRELRRLLVHGMLHLLGMDHDDPALPGWDAAAQPMLALQEQLIGDLEPLSRTGSGA